MLILDRQTIDQDFWLEIRSRWSAMPPFLADLERLGVQLTSRSRLLRLEISGGPPRPDQLAELIDPQTEDMCDVPPVVAASRSDAQALPPFAGVDVFCRPGVTDTEGEMAALALKEAGVGDVTCHAGLRYRFAEPVAADLRRAVERLLGNSLIHQFLWHGEGEEARARNAVSPAREPVRTVELRDAGDDELQAISRRFSLALDLAEMQAVQRHFAALGRAPTDAEIQSIALTWSEHCSHKTFKAAIDFDDGGRRTRIDGLLRSCIAEPAVRLARPWIRSAFDDNAGVIAFDRSHDLAFKVETHNHPSALEPYGGAHTGVGGVIRDVLAVSAEPIANTDVLCFGPADLAEDAVPVGAFHPARTFREVVRGVADYGNNMGIPTVGGAVLFHRGYTANPLVFCGTLGLAPCDAHPRSPQAGDAVVLLGGRTGRDGLHGATMSSETLDRESAASSTVQIGAPITEKTLRDILPRLRDERLYHAITDCGAGGLCSAVGEMGAELGAEVELSSVPVKYEGLLPWEIWLSEAQERMILAVPPNNLPRLHQLCASLEVEATEIGRFRGDGTLRLTYHGVAVADMAMSFLHDGRPRRTLQARWIRPPARPYEPRRPLDAAAVLLRLLAHPNIASKEQVIRRYDHEVGGATVVKPMAGNGGPSDAAVLRPTRSWRGVAVAHGINPLYGEHDPYAMAMLAVDEALRNLTAVGGSIDRTALLDNFCWGDVDDPDELGRMVRAAQGCRDASLAYGVPFISGKDSLRNTSVDAAGRHSIPGTLLISAAGVVPDVRKTTTMDLKRAGSRLCLLGRTAEELGGSHFLALEGCEGGTVPATHPDTASNLMRRLSGAIRRGLVLSCHDLSEGGLAVAAAEMSLAGGLGVTIDLEGVPADTDRLEALLFGESAGRFLVEVAPENAERLEPLFAGLPCGWIGAVASNRRFVIRRRGDVVLDLSVAEIDRVWKGAGSHPLAPASADAGDEERHAGQDDRSPLLGERGGVRAPGTVGRRVRAGVLAAAGVNCDRETVEACRLAGAEAEIVHLNQLVRRERHIRDFGMLVLPGGFSYGDHLGAGAMLATVLRHRLLDDLLQFVADGRPVLGICNGFQILARLGLLGELALAPNASGRFECRWVRLRVEGPSCLFLDGLHGLELPVAHGEGRVVLPPESPARACAPLRYLDNPNGSTADIAGVCNHAGNVLGVMPHPERFVTPYQHPDRDTRRKPVGLTIFRNAVRHAGVTA